MITLVDIGNSRVKLWWHHGQEEARHAFPATWEASQEWLEARGETPDRYLLCSVVPELTARWSCYLEKRNRPVHVAGPSSPWSFTLGVARPEAVGVDRLAVLEGALTLVKPPLIVVDLGTAVTFSVLDAGRVFVGGAIAPGPRLALGALAAGTARLPRVEPLLPDRWLGRDTEEALRSGAVGGIALLVDGMTRALTQEIARPGERVAVLTTGGEAERYRARLPGIEHWPKELLFTGLQNIAGRLGWRDGSASRAQVRKEGGRHAAPPA